ncbi:hypothetical protein A359_09210 [secondary endosymbiont of Ctenarytaina eucalypti]|uniref:Uncharacterized protein n=1 Tax=secondary endosymbiont of Ctenarytaina eucalypti TaxID=1199245 RepID=J3VTI2_9ENTR|nr:hypothetical protein A359_09210 [secondary endosymbiont of Ctenarytaina eucalypti]
MNRILITMYALGGNELREQNFANKKEFAQRVFKQILLQLFLLRPGSPPVLLSTSSS